MSDRTLVYRGKVYKLVATYLFKTVIVDRDIEYYEDEGYKTRLVKVMQDKKPRFRGWALYVRKKKR